MQAFLGFYPNAASNREDKFSRSVESFLAQQYPNKELIIVSDGCEIARELSAKYVAKYPGVVIYKHEERLPRFRNHGRKVGLELATGDIICYLDTDDFFGKTHLIDIANGFTDDLDWVYYADRIVTSKIFDYELRDVQLAYFKISTGCIAHRKLNGVEWLDGYCADWYVADFLAKNYPKYKQISTDGYYLCHQPTKTDF